MLRAVAAIARTARALLAFAVLAGFTAGVPWLLIVAAGWPLDWIGWPTPNAIPSLAGLSSAVTSPWSDGMVLALLATIGWVLWAQFLRDTTIEIIEVAAAASATRRGQPRPLSRRRGPIRWVAAVLVGAVVAAVLFDAARAFTSPATASAAAADAARRPAVTVAPAHPAAPPTAQHSPRPALTIDVSATSTARPLATHRDNPAVPAWARDAPGGTHRVVAGDNLWDLAEQYLGDPHRWREIYKLNRGHEQANGYALTDPDEIHVGWVLALPARAAPAAAKPSHTENSPSSGPGTIASEATETAPAVPPPAPPASATPTPSTPEPSTPSSPAAGPSTPADSPDVATPAPGTDPSDDRPDKEAGITLPAQGWISLGLAAAIAAVAGLLRLQRRRRARLTFPAPASTAPQPAPTPPSLARVDTIGSRHLGPGTGDHRPAMPAVPAPVGLDADAAEVSLFHLPGPGVALHGDGAIPAARAILASVLTTNVAKTAVRRPVVVTTAVLLTRLLPEDAPAVGLDPDGTAYDGERLIVLADIAAAVTHAEEEMIGRRRLLDTFDAETISDLNTRTDHAETQPPYVLLIESSPRHAARLQAVATHRAALDLHPVILGQHDGIPTIEITADGTTTGDDPHPVTRLSTLGADDLAAILTMLTDTLARPEAGADVDDPPAEISPAAVTVEATEPVPVQPDDAAALVRLRVLGPVTVATDAGPIATGMRSGSYTALAVLAAHPAGRSLDQLAAHLHPDVDPTAAVKRVRTDITSARRVLRAATGHDELMFIVYDPATGRYQLDPQTVTVDLWQMLTAIDQATSSDDEAITLAALRRATDLYAGDFAEGHDHTWATDYATSYRHQIITAHARIAEILEPDHPDQAIAALEHAADLDPVNEELYQRIMRIHGRQHRPDAVRRSLRRLEERLADLGDAEPSQATRRLAERQLRPVAPASRGRP
ncbi:BTAD domain-containing putative transcriptional regulator [Micromonospora sp. WMMD1102]|uniref:BTAD domain-containing putative transcriptional regulator n=1 Tax=Micromonospora sp. WMMD1102 TaxID=3016105 RepID=UPI00241548CA|nr:BTAD domain-containing putative transcriptional regulator [Micromonospora sp. WMMD1102]MDG4790191.1 BTAD domain-containing putative transcriptional regulator [Micromonospora sp. WMMD1102]